MLAFRPRSAAREHTRAKPSRRDVDRRDRWLHGDRNHDLGTGPYREIHRRRGLRLDLRRARPLPPPGHDLHDRRTQIPATDLIQESTLRNALGLGQPGIQQPERDRAVPMFHGQVEKLAVLLMRALEQLTAKW